jgi:hypothetical protein
MQLGLLYALAYTLNNRVRADSEKKYEKEMISIFPLYALHLYVATIQQHRLMEYIFLSGYDILQMVVLIMISLRVGCS